MVVFGGVVNDNGLSMVMMSDDNGSSSDGVEW